MKYLVNKLSKWIHQQTTRAKCEGVVVGMSGGIDSSIVAVLCKQAFPDNALGIIMPCNSVLLDSDHAHLVAQIFRIPTHTVDLSTVWRDLILFRLPELSESPLKRIAQANVKSRLRMSVLYYIANYLNYLVVGTSNKSELTLGYFTKYGDGGADIEPLGNIYKTEETSLARYLGIPECIITKPPSAGLWENQQTSVEIGADYATIDKYLQTGQATPEIFNKLTTMIARNKHKTSLIPIPPEDYAKV